MVEHAAFTGKLAQCHWLSKPGLSCRLVDGIALNKPLSNLSLPDAATAFSVQQHEQLVKEIAAQLVQVCSD